MRYADRLTFIDRSDERYDPELGEYVAGDSYEVTVPCFVLDLGIEKAKLMFGDVSKSRKVAYLQNPYPKPYQLCRYDGKLYKVLIDRQSKTVLYLEGDDSLG